MSTSRSYPQRLLFPRQAAARPLRSSLRTRSTPGRLRQAVLRSPDATATPEPRTYLVIPRARVDAKTAGCMQHLRQAGQTATRLARPF
jgi:hypothetical protein